MKRAFASFSVSDTKLKIVKLSSDGKKVLKKVNIDLPKGIIVQGKVQKEEDLAKTLKEAWRKNGIRDKMVGIIIPEISTYTKILTLPTVSVDELNEAVWWQGKDFLPKKGQGMVIDWKIVRKNESDTEVLVVAIQDDVLFGYVGAVDKANLLPVVVETPSLCLERLSETNDKVKVALYRSQGVTVVSVVSGKKILLTTVPASHSEIDVIKSVSLVCLRFSTLVKEITVCGSGLTQEFVNELNARTKLPVTLIEKKVEGLSRTETQNLILPLSQQFIDPEEPQSENSVNLLPPIWVKHYQKQFRDLRLWTATLIGAFTVWFSFIAVLGSFIYFSQRVIVLSSEKEEVNSQEVQKVAAEVAAINQLSSRVGNTLGNFIYPQSILSLIKSQIIEGIEILSYDINSESGKASLVGRSTNRETLLAFKEKLEDSGNFQTVTLPLVNLLKQESTNFEIQIALKTAKK